MGHAFVNEFEQRNVHVINTFGQDTENLDAKNWSFFKEMPE